MSSPALVEIPPGKKLVAAAITQRDLPYGWDFFMENVVVSTYASHQSCKTVRSILIFSLQGVEGRLSISLCARRFQFFRRKLVCLEFPTSSRASTGGCRQPMF